MTDKKNAKSNKDASSERARSGSPEPGVQQVNGPTRAPAAFASLGASKPTAPELEAGPDTKAQAPAKADAAPANAAAASASDAAANKAAAVSGDGPPASASEGPARLPLAKAKGAPTPARTNVQALLAEVQKTFGQESIALLEQQATRTFATIPSGSRALDAALGIGGYPRGRIVEIFGPESSGKTTLTLHAIAEVQRRGGVAAFIDAEHAFDLRYAKKIGVDPQTLLVSQPDNGEQALEIAHFLTKSGGIDLIVIDSVAALVPRAEIEGEMGDPHMGLQARLMSQALRKLTAISSKHDTTFVFINQLRQKIGVVMGNPETTTGGNALKFYASVRLDVRRIGKVTVGEDVVGNRTRVKVVKNKCAPPFTEAEFDIRWGAGIDLASDLLETATAAGIVQKNGAHYAFMGSALGHGKEKTREVLQESATLRDQIVERLTAQRAA